MLVLDDKVCYAMVQKYDVNRSLHKMDAVAFVFCLMSRLLCFFHECYGPSSVMDWRSGWRKNGSCYLSYAMDVIIIVEQSISNIMNKFEQRISSINNKVATQNLFK